MLSVEQLAMDKGECIYIKSTNNGFKSNIIIDSDNKSKDSFISFKKVLNQINNSDEKN